MVRFFFNRINERDTVSHERGGCPPGAMANPAAALRHLCRAGEFVAPTAGHAPGFVQANLVSLTLCVRGTCTRR
jgi:hypothetical protein